MTSLTFSLPDELAERLQPLSEQLPRILELGLREINAVGQTGFLGTSDVLEFLVRLPSPAEVLALEASPALDTRVRELLEKSRRDGLTSAEESEWEQYQYLEHLVRLAKANALRQLQAVGVGSSGT